MKKISKIFVFLFAICLLAVLCCAVNNNISQYRYAKSNKVGKVVSVMSADSVGYKLSYTNGKLSHGATVLRADNRHASLYPFSLSFEPLTLVLSSGAEQPNTLRVMETNSLGYITKCVINGEDYAMQYDFEGHLTNASSVSEHIGVMASIKAIYNGGNLVELKNYDVGSGTWSTLVQYVYGSDAPRNTGISFNLANAMILPSLYTDDSRSLLTIISYGGYLGMSSRYLPTSMILHNDDYEISFKYTCKDGLIKAITSSCPNESDYDDSVVVNYDASSIKVRL